MKFAWIAVAAVLLVAACSKEKKPAAEGVFERLDFAVDSSLLGDDVTVGGVHLHAPADWLPVDTSVMRKLVDVAERDTTVMQLYPEQAFKPEDGGPMLLVSIFPKTVHLGTGFIPWAGEVAKSYREARPDVVVQEQWMSLSGVEALQLYAQSGQLVHVKILLNADQPVSLDYTVPAPIWPNQVRAVESSLGSLRKVYP
ncbi:MAG: hypothetical protein H6507_11615 [Calditrichaeota bacterium]|nr:hypothetical protein [Calditrichota bacterium]